MAYVGPQIEFCKPRRRFFRGTYWARLCRGLRFLLRGTSSAWPALSRLAPRVWAGRARWAPATLASRTAVQMVRTLRCSYCFFFGPMRSSAFWDKADLDGLADHQLLFLVAFAIDALFRGASFCKYGLPHRSIPVSSLRWFSPPRGEKCVHPMNACAGCKDAVIACAANEAPNRGLRDGSFICHAKSGNLDCHILSRLCPGLST